MNVVMVMVEGKKIAFEFGKCFFSSSEKIEKKESLLISARLVSWLYITGP